MTDRPLEAISGSRRGVPGRRPKIGSISLEGLPSDAEVAAQPHKGEAADRFTLYTPEQVAAETRTVRLDMSFGDLIKIRDQALMIIEAMQLVVAATKRHDIGTIRQRIDARREADSLRRVLARFNGKVPHGDTAKKKD